MTSLFHCILCSKPLDLTTDLNTDENGKAAHAKCYATKLTGKSSFRKWVTSPIYFSLGPRRKLGAFVLTEGFQNLRRGLALFR
jgi:hypothetical protein